MMNTENFLRAVERGWASSARKKTQVLAATWNLRFAKVQSSAELQSDIDFASSHVRARRRRRRRNKEDVFVYTKLFSDKQTPTLVIELRSKQLLSFRFLHFYVLPPHLCSLIRISLGNFIAFFFYFWHFLRWNQFFILQPDLNLIVEWRMSGNLASTFSILEYPRVERCLTHRVLHVSSDLQSFLI